MSSQETTIIARSDSARFVRTITAAVALAFALVVALVTTLTGPAFAVELTPAEGASRFSPLGFKGALGLGTLEPSDGQRLDQGGASFLALGYGVDPNVTLWLTAFGSEHEQLGAREAGKRMSDAGGLEVSLQYSLGTHRRLQPYGRIGLGAYSVEDRKTHDAMFGGGVRVGIGADYFFSRRCGVGLELVARGVEYSENRLGKDGDFEDLPEKVSANSGGVVFTFTVQ